MFDEMLGLAMIRLVDMDDCPAGLPAPHVTVLLSKQGSTYITENDMDGAICPQLRENGDTQIVKSLTVWKGGQIDLPSYQFRKALLALDERNRDAELILQGKGGVITKKLSAVQRI